VFHAPLGYLISGTGATLFLLYGLLDLWWHSIDPVLLGIIMCAPTRRGDTRPRLSPGRHRAHRAGHGRALSQPGPPPAVSWTVESLPAVALIVIIAVAWRRTRPGKQPLFA
jgi:hypothetical protein